MVVLSRRIMKKVMLVVLLFLVSCVAQPYVQPTDQVSQDNASVFPPASVPVQKVVEKVVVQCWDNSMASSVDECPAKPAKVQVAPPAPAESNVPIARKFLDDAQNKFTGYAYLLSDRMVIQYKGKVRHYFFTVQKLDDGWITDVFVDLDGKTALAYCNIDREADIFSDGFDLARSRCHAYLNKSISVPFEEWAPHGPLDVLAEFANRVPVRVEDNVQTISIGGSAKTIQPSVHYLVDGKRVVLRMDKRYHVPLKVEREGDEPLDFRDTFFDTMILEGKPTKITPQMVEYAPPSGFWAKAEAK